MNDALRRWLRAVAGLAAGGATGLAALPLTLLAAVTMLPPLPPWRRRVMAGAGWLANLERARLARFLGAPAPTGAAGPGALGYVAARLGLAVLGVLVLAVLLVGAGYASLLLWLWFLVPPDRAFTVVYTGFGGVLLLFLAAHGVFAVSALEVQLARRFFGPSTQQAMQRRIDELASSRAGVVEAVHDERRRIERDLHDGVQQRLVALGMLLGRARRHGGNADELLAQAVGETRQALAELREVAWRVYPAVLDEAGLAAALESVAERAPLPVTVEYAVPEPAPRTVETVAYFVVSEAVTNAVKHSGAGRVTVRLERSGGRLTVTVGDDGKGGADPGGGGLTGLARRVAALDGLLGVDSPPGGPTTIRAELPCA
ncbi:sensor histidine kinase [Streptomyces sp. 8K308]|uniref:sensor histidine kinase n=1 Tax=Streptomyces sp. 8K308 TaxID=2530388 RepID=UPI00104AF2B5|nr:histidine kinase [Streptomyces sp. 8K308]TDC22979.1 sensor histidine kinase [Streptomyces sp. 8K308]